jgi:hypothetical protein
MSRPSLLSVVFSPYTVVPLAIAAAAVLSADVDYRADNLSVSSKPHRALWSYHADKRSEVQRRRDESAERLRRATEESVGRGSGDDV